MEKAVGDWTVCLAGCGRCLCAGALLPGAAAGKGRV